MPTANLDESVEDDAVVPFTVPRPYRDLLNGPAQRTDFFPFSPHDVTFSSLGEVKLMKDAAEQAYNALTLELPGLRVESLGSSFKSSKYFCLCFDPTLLFFFFCFVMSFFVFGVAFCTDVALPFVRSRAYLMRLYWHWLILIVLLVAY